jgi:Cation transporter/ATPase, N-terminus/Cation transporting ATPase, C-terminus
VAWHTLGADQVLRYEGVDGQRGLSSAEAAARAQRFGPNKLAAGKADAITTSGSFVLLVLSTVLGIFQTVMKTATLDVRQWLICAAVALSVVAAAEIRKALLRRTAAPPGMRVSR